MIAWRVILGWRKKEEKRKGKNCKTNEIQYRTEGERGENNKLNMNDSKMTEETLNKKYRQKERKKNVNEERRKWQR